MRGAKVVKRFILVFNDVQNQFKAMSTAMNAFADVLQVNMKSKGVGVVFESGIDIGN